MFVPALMISASTRSNGAASLGDDLEPVRPLEDGPEQFARLAGGPPPPEFKIFLAGTAS